MRFLRSSDVKSVALLLFLTLFLNVHAKENLSFDEFYSSVGVLGLTVSDKVKNLTGKKVAVKGFMAPPLKAEADFFVLTKMPMALCPFCSSDADWPSDILVIYLKNRQTFVQYNAIIQAEGILEYGSWTDPRNGFVSLMRLRDATFKKQ